MKCKLSFDNYEFEIDLKNRPSIIFEEEEVENGIFKLKKEGKWQPIEVASENKIEWNDEKDIMIKIDYSSKGQEYWELLKCSCEFKENKSILNYKACKYLNK